MDKNKNIEIYNFFKFFTPFVWRTYNLPLQFIFMKVNIYNFDNYEPTALLADGLPARKRLYIYLYLFIFHIVFFFYRPISAFSSLEGNNFKIIYINF